MEPKQGVQPLSQTACNEENAVITGTENQFKHTDEHVIWVFFVQASIPCALALDPSCHLRHAHTVEQETG